MFLFLTISVYLYFSFGRSIGQTLLRTEGRLGTTSWKSRILVSIGSGNGWMHPVLPPH